MAGRVRLYSSQTGQRVSSEASNRQVVMSGGVKMQRCDSCGGAAAEWSTLTASSMWLPLGMCLLVAVCP